MPDLGDIFKLIARLGGDGYELATADLDRIRDACARLDVALMLLARAKWTKDEKALRHAEGDLEVARGRFLEAMASLEQHGTEAIRAALAAAVRMLIERRI